jgi:general secretion pathway protein M
MINRSREELISVGVLGALLAVCASMVVFSLQARVDAVHEFDSRAKLLSQLEARAKSDETKRRSGVAPAAAFVSAPTQGLAGAQLQAYLQHVMEAHHAVLISSGTEPAKHEDQPNSIRLQATFEANLKSLQTLLYQLESGTPYAFVESLNIQPAAANSQRPVEDPLLRITLELRSVWRRDKA